MNRLESSAVTAASGISSRMYPVESGKVMLMARSKMGSLGSAESDS